ncbi:MAG: low molecular weight phosphotyrosine protein phosphatase [Xanthomonadales bacterium]|nr:low molecular weight phosphotyrosine protein phosphatase [Xanthomonadales bacterium]
MSSVSLGRGSSVERHGPSVLVVCMGNICRSPIAEGLLRHHARREGVDLYIDSAGTHAYHVGEPPDARARRVCRARGLPIDDLRARQVHDSDRERFDWILAADRTNLRMLQARFGGSEHVQLLLEFAGVSSPIEVPDPYYEDESAFEAVFDLLDGACAKVLRRVTSSA